MSATTDEMLREVGDLAAANSVWNYSPSEKNESERREAEERAHSAGVSWTRIDKVRVVGFLNQKWLHVRNSPHFEESIRASLLETAKADAWQLRYMVAVEVLRSRQHRVDNSTTQSLADTGQQRRNMAGLAANVETIAVLIDMTESERATVRANAMDDWPRMMAGTAEVMDTPDAIEEVWRDDLGDPWFQSRSDRIADTLRHPIPEPNSRVLVTPEELAAQARRALEAEPPRAQLDRAVHLHEAGDVGLSASIEAAIHPATALEWEPGGVPAPAAEAPDSQDPGLLL
ncbi:hypothetical protein IU459_33645 [Nocardia amamiensis]|uniref:DUF222 domain-containing protein n=1 Tax=Nocardia amamiensis TaxID=404578 RepID=A0ABS0D2W7_9NOCA|nr:hypothetical protein [Nocardia amamiensis]MBF6302448.1 hypothetical protein [Nocardia amamiensis]